jgi:hypothetical protein
MFRTKAVEKIKTPKSCGTVRRAADENKTGRTRTACWITKTTFKTTQYVLLFHCNNGYANAPGCDVYTYIACLVTFTLKQEKDRSSMLPQCKCSTAVLAPLWIGVTTQRPVHFMHP